MKKSYITGKNHDFYSRGKAMFDQIPPITQSIPQIPQEHSSSRQWVGLTDEEIQECYSEAYKIVQGRQLEIAFYKTIEAKLKEKNT